MLKGSCLCGGVRFELTGGHSRVRLCHCSLCRKCSGAGAIAKIVTRFADLKWISGKDLVRYFERPSGYGNAFCSVCGSPAPESDRGERVYAVPVGLLDDNPELEVAAHSYVGSKAVWDVIGDTAPQFEEERP